MKSGSKEETLRQTYEKGHDYELKYHGCSQCTILALQDVLEMRDDSVFKAASGFVGGIGDTGNTCGSLLGAAMMLSLKYGRGREEVDDKDKVGESFPSVSALYRWFEEEFGSTRCHDIRTMFGGGTYYDFRDPRQSELAEKAGVYEKCADLVGKTAARAAEMLWDEPKK